MLEKKARLVKKGTIRENKPTSSKKALSPAELREQWLKEKRAKSEKTRELRRELFGR